MSSPPQPNESPSSQTACCTAKQADRAKSLGAPGRKTRPWFLVTGCVVALLALAFWRPLQRTCAAYFLLRSPAPSEEVLSEAGKHASDVGALLARMWQTHKLPHRQFVLRSLGRVSASKTQLLLKLEPLVIDAAADPDVEVRQLAFALLARLKHPQLRRLALEQLSDADPAVRLIGLQSLRRIATSNDVPIAMRLLKDPEPRVVVAAALVLRQATSQDFGIKATHAMPQFTCLGTNPPPAPDLQAIARGVQRWQEWWSVHRREFQAPFPTSLPRSPAISLAAPDFTLSDSMGKAVQLSQFMGRNVLLAFWSPGAPASLDDVPALKALQQRNAERLAILGICLPAAPSCADEHQPAHGQGHEHAHHHQDESSATAQGPIPISTVARQAADRLQLNFPMLVDQEGKIGPRFSADDLPVYVLIDSEGRIRRRFVGFRTESALSAMVEQLTASTTRAHASAG